MRASEHLVDAVVYLISNKTGKGVLESISSLRSLLCKVSQVILKV